MADELEPGVYRYTAGEHPANIAKFLELLNWRSFYLDGTVDQGQGLLLGTGWRGHGLP